MLFLLQAVPHAYEDSVKIAKMIEENPGLFDEVIVTLDTHDIMHIAHSRCWYRNESSDFTVDCTWGKECGCEGPHYHPKPEVKITFEDIHKEKWLPTPGLEVKYDFETYDKLVEWCKYYTKKLNSKIKLTIWPEHCIQGTIGHQVVPNIKAALEKWEKDYSRKVTIVEKSPNCRTEMYSALVADVPVKNERSTQFNEKILVQLRLADVIVVCGQAMSHCVNRTVRDIVDNLHQDASKILLLKDGII